MAEPPVDLNQYIGHEEILQAFDLPVKAQLPTVTVCPLCRQEALHVYVTPGTGGRWYYCRICSFAGDSVELYQSASGLSSLRLTIREMVEQGLLKKEGGPPTTEEIRQYEDAYVKRRRRINTAFSEMQEVLVSWKPPWVSILQQNHLWGGFHAPTWHRLLGRFIGGAAKESWQRAGLLDRVPRGYATSIVMPYYDVPGRIVSLGLLSKKGIKRIYTTHDDVLPEVGLMMMETVSLLDDEPVLATSDPITALQLQRRNFNLDTTPLKLLVYGGATSSAWQSISARRVIFWDSNGFRLFSQAKNHPRAYVAPLPAFDRRLSRIQNLTLPDILDTINRNAYTWAEAMRDFILSEKPAVVDDTVNALGLEDYERTRIYDVATPEQRVMLRRRFNEMPINCSTVIDKVRVEETDNGWWAVYKHKRERISNVIIRIEKAIHKHGTETNTYSGTLRVEEKSVRFDVDMKLAERQPFDWLQAEMMRSGLGPPSVSTRFRSKLIELAKRFHEPSFVQGYGELGWNSDKQAFLFPNFSVRDGRMDDTAYGEGDASQSMPGANLTMEPLSHGDWDIILSNEPEWAVLWAGIACFMTNLAAPTIGVLPQPTCFVGGMGSAAGVIGKHLANEVGMLSAGIGTMRKDAGPWSPAEALTKQYNYPAWVDIDDVNRFSKKAKFSDRPNIMTQLPRHLAAALGVGDAWVFVNAPRIVTQRHALPRLTGVMRFLGWWQMRKFALPAGTSPQGSVLQLLKEWADDELKSLNLDVFDAADKVLLTSDSLSLDRRLLWFLFSLCELPETQVDYKPFYPTFTPGTRPKIKKGRLLLIDESARRVYVNGTALNVILRRFPMPALDSAIKELATDASRSKFEPGADGFVIDLDYWETEVGRWRQWHG